MSDVPPDLSPGDPRPGAAWFNKLLAALRANRVVVSAGGELETRRTPSGTVVHFARYGSLFPGVTTSTVTARSGTTLGSGTVALHRLVPPSIVQSASVTAYWQGSATLISGTHVWVGVSDGYYAIISADCVI